HFQANGIEHLEIPTRDYAYAPSQKDICKAVDFINRHALQGNTTYVHCKAGRGRSTTVVLCYLIKYKNMTPEDAWAHTKSIRPRVCLTSTQEEAVALFSKLNLDGDLPFQSSVGAAARPRPNTRKIQPDPSDHPEL
uniref:Uncharacterized protein n=1 Tax=Aegilops tauschii subsp. strangulata TaxID=200361 RepID=A0A452ZLC3_AEGTS